MKIENVVHNVNGVSQENNADSTHNVKNNHTKPKKNALALPSMTGAEIHESIRQGRSLIIYEGHVYDISRWMNKDEKQVSLPIQLVLPLAIAPLPLPPPSLSSASSCSSSSLSSSSTSTSSSSCSTSAFLGHPGGSLILSHFIGVDATAQMHAMHPSDSNSFKCILASFKVAKLATTTATTATTTTTTTTTTMQKTPGPKIMPESAVEEEGQFFEEKECEDLVNNRLHANVNDEGVKRRFNQIIDQAPSADTLPQSALSTSPVASPSPSPSLTPSLDLFSAQSSHASEHVLSSSSLLSISSSPLSVAFAAFEQQLRADGLFTCNMSFYYMQAVKLVLLLASSMSLLFMYPSSLLCVFVSAFLLACFWQQSAFFAHDCGHNSVTGLLKYDTKIGIVLGNLLGGISIGWWKHSHNVHHVVTNDPMHDPDIQHLPFLAVDSVFKRNLYSSYYKRFMMLSETPVALFFVRLQKYLYYPLLMLGRFNLYANSFDYILNRDVDHSIHHRCLELFMITLFWVWQVSLIVFVLPSFPLRLCFVVTSHALTFILHIQITLSHYSMSVASLFHIEEEWICAQLRTTLDIECSSALDWFHGGLQFQAVHHIFPRMPRQHLREAQKRLRAFAVQQKLDYKTMTFTEGNLKVLSILDGVSKDL